MEAKEHAFSFIAGHNYFDIPFFQRNYVWEEANWKDLLVSLCESKTGFLGSIILKQESTASGETARFMVIDGQQRLTTLSILLRACYDSIIKLNEQLHYSDDVLNRFKSKYQDMCYVTTDSFTGEKDIKIHHSHLDKKDYEIVINGNVADNPAKVGIIGAYNYFIKELALYDKVKLQNLWNTLTDGTVKLIVKIDLTSNENEQAIFDAINTSGMRLTCADTIKNYLFQRLIEQFNNNNQHDSEELAFEIYKDNWLSIFQKDDECSYFWSQESLTGRVKRDNIEVLLHCVAIIKEYFDPEGDKFSDLADCYKRNIEGLSSESIISLISEIHEYAVLFLDNMQIDSTTRFAFDDYLQRLLCVCKILDISTFNPYILYLLKKYSNEEDVLRKKCFELEQYIMLHALCDATTKNYNKECVQLIRNNTSTSYLLATDYEINEHNFIATLNDLKRKDKLSKLLLFWCELFERKNNNTDFKDLTWSFELEHVLPKAWKNCWSIETVPVYKDCVIVLDREEAMVVRNDHVNSIGNLTLLNKKLNIQISNSNYQTKVNGQGKSKGMKLLSDFYLTRSLIEKYPSWDERSIDERTTYFVGLISKIWQIDWKIVNNRELCSDSSSIIDENYIIKLSEPASRFTDKKIRNFSILFDSTDLRRAIIPDNNKLTECFVYILNYLIEKGYNLGKIMKVSRIKNVLSYDKNAFDGYTTVSLNNGICLKTQLSNNDKILMLQKVFELFNIDPDSVEFVVKK